MCRSISQREEEIVTEIAMSKDGLPWLVLEGSSDKKFIITRDLPGNPKPVVAIGWINVVGVIAKVIEENIAATVFGFIDRDYREYLGIEIDYDRIVVTDFKDLEVSMFESDALHKILIELGSQHKLPKDGKGSIDLGMVKDKIYLAASTIGKIRFYSLQNDLRIPFINLDFSKFIDPRTLEIDLTNLVAQINSEEGISVSRVQIDNAISMVLPSKLDDCKFISRGHDIIDVLGISLRRLWGSNAAGVVSRATLERHFRIGYSNDEFRETKMFKRLYELLS